MYYIELPQMQDLNGKRHQVALLVRKEESKHENENISTGESLLGKPGVRNYSQNMIFVVSKSVLKF